MAYPNTKGTDLNAEDQRLVLSSYVHRHTKDHKPAWVTWEAVQFDSDRDWLENSLFATRKDGRIDARNGHCFSSPTWPDGIKTKPA